MIKILMDLALRERVVVIGAAVLLAIAGFYSFRELDIEAYPDPVQPRVEIITQPLGLSAEEVEKIATIPLEVGLAGIRNLEAMRTISLFGLSDVKLYFTWDSDYYWDRVETINRLGLGYPAAKPFPLDITRQSDRRNLPLYRTKPGP